MIFKPIETEDELVFLNGVRNDCAAEFLHDSSTYSLDDTRRWHAQLKTPYYIVYDDGKKIGYFRTSNYSSINKNMYIGMDLHREFRGKGLAFQAYIVFIPYVFFSYLLNKVSLEVLASNIKAYDLYKRLGFVEEGIKRQEVYKNGIYIDSIIMSMLKSEMMSNKLYANDRNTVKRLG